MRIRLVERGACVEATGASEEILALVLVLLSRRERITFVHNGGAAAMLWNAR